MKQRDARRKDNRMDRFLLQKEMLPVFSATSATGKERAEIDLISYYSETYTQKEKGGLREKQWVCVLGAEGAEGAGGVSPSMLTLRKDEGERKKAPVTCGPIHNPSTWGLLYGAGIKARTREEPDTSHAQNIAPLKVRHFSFLRLSCVACGILVPRPGIKPILPALRAQS